MLLQHRIPTPEMSDVRNIAGCSKYYRMFEILPDIEILPVGMVPYGRRTDRGLKYLLVEDKGSGSFPLPSDDFLVFTP